jgi:hypothetical protein
MLNRFKLGRTRDEVNTYGGDLLFSEIAFAVCQQEVIEQHFNPLDTTSFSLWGGYVPERDQQAIAITHGYSKDHRPASGLRSSPSLFRKSSEPMPSGLDNHEGFLQIIFRVGLQDPFKFPMNGMDH